MKSLVRRLLLPVMLTTFLTLPVPAWALPDLNNGPIPCPTGHITASLSVSPASITPGQPTTVQWNVHSDDGCPPVNIRLYYRDATTGVLLVTDVAVLTD